MNIFDVTFAAAAVLTLGTAAFADGHAFDADMARLDMTLDTDGDGDVSDDELIDGNLELFDLNGDGVIDAEERGEAEIMIEAES